MIYTTVNHVYSCFFAFLFIYLTFKQEKLKEKRALTWLITKIYPANEKDLKRA